MRIQDQPSRGAARIAWKAPLLAIIPALCGCGGGNLSFLDPQGPVAAAQRSHFYDILALLVIVVLPVLLLTPFFAWRYRYSGSQAPYRPKWSFSWPLEIIIWAVPVAVVAALVPLLWIGTHDLDPYAPLVSQASPERVQVVGYDWKWLFIYPDEGIASVGELAFPVDRPVSLELTSNTVMQSFFIPALGSQIYAMNGMVTRLNLKADRPGRFLGENTQYNGTGFHAEKFVAEALTADAFGAWVAAIRGNGMALDARAITALDHRNTNAELAAALNVAPGLMHFRDVPSGLFKAIVEPGSKPVINEGAKNDDASPPRHDAAIEAAR